MAFSTLCYFSRKFDQLFSSLLPSALQYPFHLSQWEMLLGNRRTGAETAQGTFSPSSPAFLNAALQPGSGWIFYGPNYGGVGILTQQALVELQEHMPSLAIQTWSWSCLFCCCWCPGLQHLLYSVVPLTLPLPP